MIPKLAGKPQRLGVYYFRVYWFRVGLIAVLSALSIACQYLGDRTCRQSLSEKQSVIVRAENVRRKTEVPTNQKQMALSTEYTVAGYKYYEKFQFREAQAQLVKAVQANPDNTKARYLLQMTDLLLGENQTFRKSSDLVDQGHKTLQQQRTKLKGLFDRGEKLFKEEKYERAIHKYKQVLERVKWSPYNIDSEGLEDLARKKHIEARSLMVQAEIRRQEEQERTSLNSEQADDKVVESLKRRLVLRLTMRAMNQLRQNKFASAEATTREILALDSDNQTARRLQDAAINGGYVRYGSAIDKADREELRRSEELNRENCGSPLLEVKILPEDEEGDAQGIGSAGVVPPGAKKD